jgi:hypothetical protein
MWVEIFSEEVAAYQTARGHAITPSEIMNQVNSAHEQDANSLARSKRSLHGFAKSAS